jgi:peptidoglycan hydrolase-like protein with peptidoglycan-binding domain
MNLSRSIYVVILIFSIGILVFFGYHLFASHSSPIASVSSHSQLAQVVPGSEPVISSVDWSSLTAIGITITWTTDEAANSQVNYGITSAYGTPTPVTDQSPMVTSHTVTLTGLLPDTRYYYDVVSEDASNNISTSTDRFSGSFVTPPVATPSGPVFYIAQTAQRNDTGADCADALSVGWLQAQTNDSIYSPGLNWGAGSGQIGPGTTINLCGTITFPANSNGIYFYNSGTSGHPITLFFEPNAIMTSPAFGTAILIQNQNWIIVDGGTNGTIQNMANGTGLAYAEPSHGVSVVGSNITVEDLTISDICQHTSFTDTNGCIVGGNGDGGIGIGDNNGDTNVNVTVTKNTVHDTMGCISYAATSNDSDVTISDNTLYRCNWGISSSGTISTTGSFTISGNDISCVVANPCNWDAEGDAQFHHNGIMIFPQGPIMNNVVIANNYIHDINGDTTGYIFSDPLSPNEIPGSLIYNNVFYTTAGQSGPSNGMIMGAAGSRIFNNTMAGPGVASFGGNSGSILENNIADGQNDVGSLSSAVNSITSAYNEFYGWGSGGGWWPCTYGPPCTSFPFFQQSTQVLGVCTGGCDTVGSFLADPELTSSLMLSPTSPAIGAGTNLTSLGISGLDISAPQYFGVNYACGAGCVPRPRTNPWDIGAYQYSSSYTSPANYTLSIVNPTGNGTITSSPPGISCSTVSSTCSASFGANASVTLTATPDPGDAFFSWDGACSGTSPTCMVTMSSDKFVDANQSFHTIGQPPHNELYVTPSSGGTITSTDGNINCGSACSIQGGGYPTDTNVTLTATPSTGYTFSSWLGACLGTSPTCNLTILSNAAVSAVFTTSGSFPTISTLTITSPTGGTITSSDGNISCGSTCSHSYANGSSTTLTETPSSGYTFSSWGGSCSGTSTTCNLTISSNTSVSASFSSVVIPPTLYTLSYTHGANGTLTGSTTQVITSGSNGTAVHAVPNTNYVFSQWSDGSTNNPRTDSNVTSDHSFSASFSAIASPTISSISASPVSSNSATISWTTNQPATDQVEYGVTPSYGSQSAMNRSLNTSHSVSLSPLTPATVYDYAVISTNGSGITSTSSNQTFTTTASGIASTYTLTITSPSNGTITSSDSAISCGSTCIETTIASGTSITLTATPSANYTFSSWSGCTSSTSTCPLTILSNTTVSASFSAVAAAPVVPASSCCGGGGGGGGGSTALSVSLTNISITTASTSATITWTTNTPVLSQVSYGLTSIHGSQTAESTTSTTTHTAVLSYLIPNTVYHYSLLSLVSGYTPVSSSDYTFTTTKTGTQTVSVASAPTITTPTASITPPTIPGCPAGVTCTPLPGISSTPSPTALTISLSQGMINPQVAILQNILDTHGYPVSSSGNGSLNHESTYFGSATLSAVERFQCTTMSICSTTPGYGLVGPKTRTALNALGSTASAPTPAPTTQAVTATTATPASTPVTTPTTFSRNLSLGMSGSDVKALQVFLNTHGFIIATSGNGSPNHESTYYGPATKAALVRFQSAHGIPATGYFGVMTRTAIQKEM